MSIYADKRFASQCELALALNRAEFAETEKKLYPDSDSCSLKIGSGYAVFAGAESPLSKATALGFDDGFSESQILELEEFYHSKNSSAAIEVSQLADMDLTHGLLKREFTISDYTNALARRITTEDIAAKNLSPEIKIVGQNDLEQYIKTTTGGFLNIEVSADNYNEEMKTLRKEFDKISEVFYHQLNSTSFLACKNGTAAGTAGLYSRGNFALFLAAATLTEYRFKGIQTDLIRHRIHYAATKELSIALSITYPGSISQHNLEKSGFQVIYGRITFKKGYK